MSVFVVSGFSLKYQLILGNFPDFQMDVNATFLLPFKISLHCYIYFYTLFIQYPSFSNGKYLKTETKSC